MNSIAANSYKLDVYKFCEAVTEEVFRANFKFPSPNPNLAALMEEVGELSRAFLEKKSFEDIFSEAVQVAAMAARCAIEGDPQFSDNEEYLIFGETYKSKLENDKTKAEKETGDV